MKPDVPAVLTDLSAKLRRDIIPELTGFQAGATSMTSAMLEMVAEDWDRCADRLIKENRALRALLARGAELMNDFTLEGVVESENDDFRISALSSANDKLRRALIDLHAHVEQRADDSARALEHAIWDELRRSVEARRISSASF